MQASYTKAAGSPQTRTRLFAFMGFARSLRLCGKTCEMKLPRILLLIDDAIVLFIVALFGIRFHQTDPSLFVRLPYTLFPFLAAWVLFAAPLRLYDPATASAWNQLWRIPITAALSASVGAAVRALWLGTQVVPIFVVVMGVAITIGILISRSVLILIFGSRWTTPTNG